MSDLIYFFLLVYFLFSFLGIGIISKGKKRRIPNPPEKLRPKNKKK